MSCQSVLCPCLVGIEEINHHCHVAVSKRASLQQVPAYGSTRSRNLAEKADTSSKLRAPIRSCSSGSSGSLGLPCLQLPWCEAEARTLLLEPNSCNTRPDEPVWVFLKLWPEPQVITPVGLGSQKLARLRQQTSEGLAAEK